MALGNGTGPRGRRFCEMVAYERRNPREVPTGLEIGTSRTVVENEGREVPKKTRGSYFPYRGGNTPLVASFGTRGCYFRRVVFTRGA
jgi:hypothetical protein